MMGYMVPSRRDTANIPVPSLHPIHNEIAWFYILYLDTSLEALAIRPVTSELARFHDCVSMKVNDRSSVIGSLVFSLNRVFIRSQFPMLWHHTEPFDTGVLHRGIWF